VGDLSRLGNFIGRYGYHEDYAHFLADIETEIAIQYGSSPTIEETSEGIYEYLCDNIVYNTNNDCWTDLKIIRESDSSSFGCAEFAILTSAIGRAFEIPTQIVHIDYSEDDNNQADHFFVEFYWSGSWHVVDPALGFFDDIVAAKIHYNSIDPAYCSIIYEYFLPANPRKITENPQLNTDVVYYRPYNNQPYYD